ncbi:MAG: ArsR family transcriptional regulator [Bacteroidales bacterium]|nr:ArsR family transcriptional regulator [Bacteroidales bacterium]
MREGLSEGLNRLLSLGISEGLNEGISEGFKENLVEILKLLIKEKGLRITEISEKLQKPQKTLERHIKILKRINAIEYKGSKRTGGYVLSKIFLEELNK